MKITKENYKEVLGKILKIIAEEGKTVYFNIAYWEFDGVSPCYFTPIAPLRKGDYCLFPDDYEKLLVMLLTHPKVREIELDEEEGSITAIFDVPEEYYWEEGEEVEV